MDHDNDIVGVDFFDDASCKPCQCLSRQPSLVLYENIHFPHLPDGKVVGRHDQAHRGADNAAKKHLEILCGSVF